MNPALIVYCYCLALLLPGERGGEWCIYCFRPADGMHKVLVDCLEALKEGM
jgi:hypothetical protein